MSEAPDTEVTEAAPAPEAAPASTPAQSNAQGEIETAARAGGWVPKDEWKGEPDDWRDAPQFVLKAAEILPQLTKDLKDARADIKSLNKAVAESAKLIGRAETRAYEQARSDLEQRLETAAALSDTGAVKEINQAIVDLEKDVRAEKPAPEPNPDFETWRTSNPWFDTDPEMKAITIAIAEGANKDGYTGKAQIAEVDRRLKVRFPNLGKNPNRDLAGAVEGATPQQRKGGKAFTDMPAEAREMCAFFEKTVKGFKRDSYVKDYFA